MKNVSSAFLRFGRLSLGAMLLLSTVWCQAEKPNLLVIVADDLGYGDVGFNGNKAIPTPNLDKLASTGVNLTDFRSCPMCSPTRAGLLTGRWPIRFRVMNSVVPPWSTNGMPPAEVTIAELLAGAGYQKRGLVGKWHLGHARNELLPLAQGFTSFYGHYNGAIDYFDHTREGEVDWHRNAETVREEGYATDLLGAEAARFVREAKKPWFLYVALNAPHSPFQAKPDDIAKYKRAGVAKPVYAAMVDSMDQAIGKMLDALEAQGTVSNTLVLFFSDNGGIPNAGSSNKPWRGAKLTVYEGGTRVCAAIRWPAGGLQGGRRFEQRMGYIDVLPTLLSAAGVKIPSNIDGANCLPALQGKAKLPERAWFSYMHQNEQAHASVHRGPWKLVAHGNFFEETPATPPALELFNLEKDPAEATDLASREAAMVSKLHKELGEFGKLQKSRGLLYGDGRDGYVPPKDWIITK